MGNYAKLPYHYSTPEWRTTRNKPRGQYVGVELEISNVNGYNRTLEALPEPSNKKLRPLTEADGSINYQRDVEIIFPPYKYSAIKNGNSYITKAMAALRDANSRGTEATGMHVNLNTTGWGKRARKLFVAVCHELPQATIEGIGGRDLTRHCRQHAGSIDWVVYLSKNSHNTVVSLRDNRVELRFPATTTDINRLRLIVDFGHYVERFVRSLPADINTANRLSTELGASVEVAFRAFLNAQKKTKALKNLLLYMAPPNV